ncbi:MAG: DUF4340 domain-containing protein [bacterium]
MKRPGMRGALVHGALLGVALIVAYVDWTRPKAASRKPTDVTVWEGQAGDITAVHLESTLAKVDLTIKKDAGTAKPYPWFRLERTITLPAPAPEKKDEKAAPPTNPDADHAAGEKGEKDAAADAAKATPPAPQTKVTVKEFLGAERTKERLEKIATLVAERDLGKPESATLEKLGLAKPRGSLTIQTAKGERKLELGDTAVGDRLRYVRDPASGRVYAVDTNLVSDLEQADTRLLNSDLQPFNADAIEKAVVSVGGASRTYAQRDRDKAGKSYWVVVGGESASSGASSESAEEKDERATTWFGKLARLKAERYLASDENPLDTPAVGAAQAAPVGPTETKPVLRIEYDVAGYPPATLELEKVTAGPDKVAFVARTSYTRSRVLVNRFTAEEIEKDLNDLFGV